MGESSAAICRRVAAARRRQLERFHGTPITANARMSTPQLKKYCVIDNSLGDLLQQAMEQRSLGPGL